MAIFGVYENPENIRVPDALLIALIAILIVFFALGVVTFITYLAQKGTDTIEKKMNILPRKENAILASDEDAVVAALTAVIDFHKEMKKDARIVSITRIEE